MSRYIDADMVIGVITNSNLVDYEYGLVHPQSVITAINNIPTADVEEVKHGEWRDTTAYCGEFTCSICKEMCVTNKYNYCPHCGTKMDGGVKQC